VESASRPLLNAPFNTAAGASWVAIHNSGAGYEEAIRIAREHGLKRPMPD
jgi:urocanate hydratase